MKKRILITTAFVAVAAIGIEFSPGLIDKNSDTGFVLPLLLSNSVCDSNGEDAASRRAFFIRVAEAAAETRIEPQTSNGMWSGFGDLGYDISTSNPEAQAWFNQGLALMYGFNHQEAINAFQKAQDLDPNCAMCFWGEALALGPNINAPMAPEAVPLAFLAIGKAAALMSNANESEQALIKALQARYSAAPMEDRSQLDHAFADAMDRVALIFPDNDFIAIQAAEANMDTQAWDYWMPDKRTPSGRTERTVDLIETVLDRNSEFAPAIHLYIHITEGSDDPYRAAPFADTLRTLTPGLGHLTHMPSHTYYKIGRYEDSLKSNVAAIVADEAYIAKAKPNAFYQFAYFTHNIHFAMTSAQMGGDAKTALAMAEKLDKELPMDFAIAVPFVQPVKAAPYFAKVQFGAFDDILELSDPGDEVPFLQAAWHYARGKALVEKGNVDAAKQEIAAIARIKDNTDFSPMVDGGIPAPDLLKIEQLLISAKIADAEGDLDAAIDTLEEAAAVQQALPYMEPPYWYYPIKQTLAATLLKDGQAARAEMLFMEALIESPNNGWATYGLAKSYEAQDNRRAAKYAKELFKQNWLGNHRAISLDQL